MAAFSSSLTFSHCNFLLIEYYIPAAGSTSVAWFYFAAVYKLHLLKPVALKYIKVRPNGVMYLQKILQKRGLHHRV